MFQFFSDFLKSLLYQNFTLGVIHKQNTFKKSAFRFFGEILKRKTLKLNAEKLSKNGARKNCLIPFNSYKDAVTHQLSLLNLNFFNLNKKLHPIINVMTF